MRDDDRFLFWIFGSALALSILYTVAIIAAIVVAIVLAIQHFG